jgi:hypothetical protein
MMGDAVEIEEVIADVTAYFVAAQIEDTENPCEDALSLAHGLLSYQGISEDTDEYANTFGVIYTLAKMGYLNVQLSVGG